MRLPFHAAAFAIAFALAAILPPSPAGAESESVVVFAAASLKNALDEIAIGWTVKSGVTVKTSYAASSALAKQIEEGAPADLFISADLDWMDYVEKKNLLKAGRRGNLLGRKRQQNTSLGKRGRHFPALALDPERRGFVQDYVGARIARAERKRQIHFHAC